MTEKVQVTVTETHDAAAYGGYTVLAARLTAQEGREVPYRRQQVHVWYCRRDRNGFPEQREVTLPDGRTKRLFNVEEVLTWKRDYVPATGGRRKTTNELT